MIDTDLDPKPAKHGALWRFVEMLPAWAKAVVAIGFIFTIWSIFTGFSLGEIMNKYADANLRQSEMQFSMAQSQSERQFEAQLQMQQMQHEATERSNTKLDDLIKTVEVVAGRLDDQGQQIKQIIAESRAQADQIAANARELANVRGSVDAIKGTVGAIARWTCEHERKDPPGYCPAITAEGK